MRPCTNFYDVTPRMTREKRQLNKQYIRPLKREQHCSNCLGNGHTKRSCPLGKSSQKNGVEFESDIELLNTFCSSGFNNCCCEKKLHFFQFVKNLGNLFGQDQFQSVLYTEALIK